MSSLQVVDFQFPWEGFFRAEFNALPKCTDTPDFSPQGSHFVDKNRYRTVIPIDNTRVKLESVEVSKDQTI